MIEVIRGEDFICNSEIAFVENFLVKASDRERFQFVPQRVPLWRVANRDFTSTARKEQSGHHKS